MSYLYLTVLSHDKSYMMSSGHDSALKFYNIKYIYEDDSNTKEEVGAESAQVIISYHIHHVI